MSTRTYIEMEYGRGFVEGCQIADIRRSCQCLNGQALTIHTLGRVPGTKLTVELACGLTSTLNAGHLDIEGCHCRDGK